MTTAPELRRVTANGTVLSYVEAGRGRPVVLVHGSLDDYRSWRYQLEPFSRHYRAVALSRRYHYPDKWDTCDKEYSVELHAKDLAAFIEMLAQPPVHLVTSSYGGVVALHLASQRPELVHSLVLGEPPLMPWLAHIPCGEAHLRRFLEEVWYAARQAFEEGRTEDGVRLFLDAVMGRPTLKHLGPRAYQMIMDNATEMQAETSSRSFYPPFTRAEARKLRQPVILCKGEKSPEIFHLITDDLAQCLPNARPPVVVPGAPHPMHIGNPVFYNHLVLDFLQGADAHHGPEAPNAVD